MLSRRNFRKWVAAKSTHSIASTFAFAQCGQVIRIQRSSSFNLLTSSTSQGEEKYE